MQVFKTYFLILKKYRGNVLLYFSVFLVLALIMTNAQGTEEGTGFSEVSVDVALVDEDGGSLQESLRDYFGKKVNFKKEKYNKKDIAEELYWRDVNYVLVIPKGFEESLQKGEEEAQLSCMQVPGNFSAVYFEAQLQLYMQKMAALVETGYSVKEAGRELAKLAGEKTKVQTASFVSEKQNDLTTTFFLYVPYLFLSVGILGIGIVLQKMNEKEVKNRTECSSVTLRERNAGMIAAIIAFGMILYLSIFVIAGVLTGGDILFDGRLPWFAWNLFVMLLFSVSLGFFTGIVAPNNETVNGIVNVAGLALCFLGGVFVPQQLFGEGVTRVARFFPTYWYVKNNSMIGETADITQAFVKNLLTQTGLILAYAVAVFAITLVIISAKRRGRE